MSIIDVAIGALILYGVIKGLFKGFFVEVTSFLALIMGVYGATHFSRYVGELLSSNFSWDKNTINITAFAATFVVIVLVVSLSGKALTKLADFAALGFINKLLGALFGGVKIAFIISGFLLIFNGLNQVISLVSDDEIQTSLFFKPVKSLALRVLPEFVITANQVDIPTTPDL